ncbi:homoserine dehydrogenase, partial [Candidatus Bipolaricaulota bacterium]|nr:homoserine dehydrogenase [Candidatus Bipolaricaulota bacterium]
RGAAVNPDGLDGHAIANLKLEGQSIGDLPEFGHSGMTGLELIDTVDADILCEAGPVNLNTGAEPALSHVRRALEKGMHVSTPNKGPIVLAYRELAVLAREHNVQLQFDGTVAGGLPAIALGARDLRGATIERIESVPNLTTGFVLDRLAAGISWDVAIEEARQAGALEGDGVWDIDGWDAAAKIAILAVSALDMDVNLAEIPRKGIRDIDLVWLQQQSQKGLVRLLASAIRQPDGSYQLDVSPVALPPEHPLGRLGSTQMGISIETDLFGTITSVITEETPQPSASTMLRDLLNIFIPHA